MAWSDTDMRSGEDDGPPTLDQTTAWHLDRIEGDVVDQGERLAQLDQAIKAEAERIAQLETNLQSSILASAVVIRMMLAQMDDPIKEGTAREVALVALREALGSNATAAIAEAIVKEPLVAPSVN